MCNAFFCPSVMWNQQKEWTLALLISVCLWWSLTCHEVSLKLSVWALWCRRGVMGNALWYKKLDRRVRWGVYFCERILTFHSLSPYWSLSLGYFLPPSVLEEFSRPLKNTSRFAIGNERTFGRTVKKHFNNSQNALEEEEVNMSSFCSVD